MEAGEILKENRLDEAYESYAALGLYLDAPAKAEYDVPYQKVEYVMECAKNSDESALEVLDLTIEDVGSRRLDIFIYEQAKGLYEEMNGYKDSEARIAEINIVFEEYQESIRKEKYRTACGLMDQKSYLQAYEVFSAMGYYEEAAELALECLYLRAGDVLTFFESNNVRNISLWFPYPHTFRLMN